MSVAEHGQYPGQYRDQALCVKRRGGEGAAGGGEVKSLT